MYPSIVTQHCLTVVVCSYHSHLILVIQYVVICPNVRLASLSAAWWQCHVHDVPVPYLAEKGCNPRKQSGYPAEAYSAELYSGNSHRWPYPWFQEVQLRSTKTGHCNRNHQRLRSGVVVWMHVFAWMVDILNINFEPLTFCCVLFVSSILVSVNVWSI